MSGRDIETVCTLAAHLAYVTVLQLDDITVEVKVTRSAAECAQDAMTLQRLAQNIRTRAKRMYFIRWGTYLQNMADKAKRILKPYGLVGVLSPTGIVIEGLPSNG